MPQIAQLSEADNTDAAFDVALAHALLRRASQGHGPALRLYRPRGRVVAFGRRDTRRPGFPQAVHAARAAGFTPGVRAPGGGAVAYTQEALVVDHVSPDEDAMASVDQRFRLYADLWARILRSERVDARVGAVSGEYCPGPYSVNARGRVKLVGTAQRVVRGSWLFSAVLIAGDIGELRPLLTEIYSALNLPFSVTSVGSAKTEVPDFSVDRVEAAVAAAYREEAGLAPYGPDEQATALAIEILPLHRVSAPCRSDAVLGNRA